ncbi:DMT family transporter [Aquibacillus rhizosphaerae]|uniref:Multidrug resistance efflux transporter family protein n=1 Tax=Aquibacillus rhizosphaerae TaxID=3051431 RepID=A0ABT7L3E1_9BACI|nr:multidrug resistance efflux transporter family protein [Aquibacillus sp. LR5S19]MDL4839722.1 multidrug resistance efflux transporter family protein [Aquibacillus sp. LR5S19]
MKGLLLGIIAAFFFSFTFLINRMMEIGGGSWYFSSSLRFFFMIPFLVLIVWFKSGFSPLWNSIKANPIPWFLWSFVGFVLFYAPITFAAGFAPGWLVAGTFQLTIVAGMLLSPLFWQETSDGLRSRQAIPIRSLFSSLVIFTGVLFIQWQHATQISLGIAFLAAFPVIISAFSYPLGNRKMMELTDGKLDTFSRVLGMTLMSTPAWIVLFIIGTIKHGLPSSTQVGQTAMVAVCSGVIATLLFFYATDLVRKQPNQLAAVEATQSMEVLFALGLELIIINAIIPSTPAFIGLLLIIVGMLLHSFLSRPTQRIKIDKELPEKVL